MVWCYFDVSALILFVSILFACTTAFIVSTTLPIYFIVSIKLKEEYEDESQLSTRIRQRSDLGSEGKAKAAIRFFCPQQCEDKIALYSFSIQNILPQTYHFLPPRIMHIHMDALPSFHFFPKKIEDLFSFCTCNNLFCKNAFYNWKHASHMKIV